MKKKMFVALAFAVGIVASSCSEEESAADETSTISGAAVKGYVGSAKVDVYQYMETGTRGKLIASTQTDAQGNYSVEVPYKGVVEIVVTQGSYLDEATGDTVELGSKELRSILSADANKTAGITALTTIAAKHVDAHASAGIETAIANANSEVASTFGLSGVDISEVIPSDLSFPANGHAESRLKYGAIQAGFSQLIEEENLSAASVLTLVEELASDFADGKVDGKSGSTALNFTLSVTPSEALVGLNVAIENYMSSSENKSGVKTSVTVDYPTQN